MGRIELAVETLRGVLSTPGTLSGHLSPEQHLTGTLVAGQTLRGKLTSYQVVRMDYAPAVNKPRINEHELRAGENTLLEIGLDTCKFTDIDALFS